MQNACWTHAKRLVLNMMQLIKARTSQRIRGVERGGQGIPRRTSWDDLWTTRNFGSGTWGARYPAENIMGRFVDNEEFWGWNGNAHLTQAMWYASEYVGCAESKKDMNGRGKMCRFQVCRYAR